MTQLAHREIKPLIGAEVPAGKDALLSGAHATDIRAHIAGLNAASFAGYNDWRLPNKFRHVAVPEAERVREQRLRAQEELDLDYRTSPICPDAGGDDFAAGPHAGAEAIDAGPLEADGRGTTLFELLRGTAHTLLLPRGSDPSERARVDAVAADVLRDYGDLLQVLVIGADGDVATVDGCRAVRDPERAVERRYAIGGDGLYVIRPDGYVGCRARPATTESVRRYFDRLLAAP